jgi:SAM-dependent methyltransferase
LQLIGLKKNKLFWGVVYDSVSKQPLDPAIVKFTNDLFETNVFKCDSIENLNTKDKFDLIVAFEVLEHIERPSDVIDRICLSLKPGGIFFGTTPYPFKNNIVSDETHISVLHPDNWKRLFKRAGFKTVNVDPMSFAPFLWRINKKLNIRIPRYIKARGFVSTSLIYAKK